MKHMFMMLQVNEDGSLYDMQGDLFGNLVMSEDVGLPIDMMIEDGLGFGTDLPEEIDWDLFDSVIS